MIYVPYNYKSEESPPPMSTECKYQIRVDSKTYKCMTENEYQEYTIQRDKGNTGLVEVPGWFVLICLLFIAVGLSFAYYKWFNEK